MARLLPCLRCFTVFSADPIRSRSFTFAGAASTKSLIRERLTSVNESLRTCTLSGVECQNSSGAQRRIPCLLYAHPRQAGRHSSSPKSASASTTSIDACGSSISISKSAAIFARSPPSISPKHAVKIARALALMVRPIAVLQRRNHAASGAQFQVRYLAGHPANGVDIGVYLSDGMTRT